jgi:hypothetical protein
MKNYPVDPTGVSEIHAFSNDRGKKKYGYCCVILRMPKQTATCLQVAVCA